MAYDTLQFVEIFDKFLIDYPKPIILTENDELARIDEFFVKYREILKHGQLLYGMILKVETYYREEDPKNKKDSIDRLEKIFTMLWTDITFISQLKDRILIKKQIELANKTLYVSILAIIIAILSLFVPVIFGILVGFRF